MDGCRSCFEFQSLQEGIQNHVLSQDPGFLGLGRLVNQSQCQIQRIPFLVSVQHIKLLLVLRIFHCPLPFQVQPNLPEFMRSFGSGHVCWSCLWQLVVCISKLQTSKVDATPLWLSRLCFLLVQPSRLLVHWVRSNEPSSPIAVGLQHLFTSRRPVLTNENPAVIRSSFGMTQSRFG